MELFMVQARQNHRLLRFGMAATALLAFIIAVLTLAPISSSGPAGSDKVYHVLAFAALAFPLALVRPRLTHWFILGVVAYGGAIEVIQPFFGRHAEWTDLLADGLGAVLGGAAGYFLSNRVQVLSRRAQS
ncbi:MAG: VanZ family protein [Octadecabacter sp.]